MTSTVPNESSSFYKQQTRDINTKTKQILKQLPTFCEEYFRGVSSRTSALTRLNYAYDLRIFFDYLVKEKFLGKHAIAEITLADLQSITVTDIEKFLDYVSFYERTQEYEDKEILLLAENGERGKSRKLSSIRALFKYLFKKEYLSSNVAALVETPKLHEKAIIRLEGDEIQKLLTAVETGEHLSERQQKLHQSTFGKRDTAIITLLLGSGIRVSECIGLNMEDVNFRENTIKVTRKGGNEVILYVNEEVMQVLSAYLDDRRKITVADDRDQKALFLSTQRTRITQRQVQRLVQKYSSVSTPLKHITPHKLRSTYGTQLYRESGDIYLVADVLGHKDVNTTKRHYAAMSEDRRKRASELVHLHEEDKKE